MSAYFTSPMALAVFFLAAYLPGTAAAAEASGSLKEAPRLVYGQPHHEGLPIWIRRDESLSPDGELRRDLFDRAARIRLSDYVSQARELQRKGHSGTTGTHFRPATAGVDCVLYMAAPVPLSFPPRTLRQLVEDTPYLVAGTVEHISDGFFRGLPASLLRLVDLEAINYQGEAPSSLYAVYYHASFVVAGQEYCSGGFPDRPRPGSRVVVGSPMGPPDEEGRLLEPLRWSVFVEDEKGRLIAPPNYADEITHHAIDDISGLVHYLVNTAEDG